MYRQLLMPLAEEGWFREEETFLIINKYLLRAPGAGLNEEMMQVREIGPRLDRYLGNIYAREASVLRSLEVPRSHDELTDLGLVSGLKLPKQQVWYLFERTMVEKHLDRLRRQGKIFRVGERYQRET